MDQTEFKQDTAKTVEATLYLCQRSTDDPNFDRIKLTKMLYFADAEGYRRLGKPITGISYLHFPHGPHPENWHLIRSAMEEAGDARVWHYDPRNYYQEYVLMPEREPNLDLFSEAELAILDETLHRYAHVNSPGIAAESRQQLAWTNTEDGEPLEYRLAGQITPSPTINSIRRSLATGPESEPDRGKAPASDAPAANVATQPHAAQTMQQVLGKPEGWTGEMLAGVYELDVLWQIHLAVGQVMPDWQSRMEQAGCLDTLVANVKNILTYDIATDVRLDELVAQELLSEEDEFSAAVAKAMTGDGVTSA